MRALILLPDRDHEPGDQHGAFLPEAQRFLQCHQLRPESMVLVDISRDQAGRRDQVLRAIQAVRAGEEPDVVAFVCHGWSTGLQLGFSLQHVPLLAAALASRAGPSLAVVLYACSTAAGHGEGEAPGTAHAGGFADALFLALTQCRPVVNVHVDGHTTAGHCGSNPYVWREGEGGAGFIVSPSSPQWRAWNRELADRHGSTLRLRYPLMTRQQIAQELG